MLIEYGNTVVLPDWELDETAPTGYSRVYQVLSGEVHYSDSTVEKQLQVGKIYALPSSKPYRCRRNPELDFACTYMHITFSDKNVNRLVELDPEESPCLRKYMGAVSCAIEEKKIELLESLSDGFQFFLKPLDCFTYSSQMLKTVEQYINSHISENIAVEDLSRLFSYNPNYFTRIFHQETGFSPYNYLLQQRMRLAITLLNRGMGNDEVAECCGYSNSSTFTRAFRSYFGEPPQKYKKGYRKP